MIKNNWCDFGDHEITEFGGYVIYSDEERGLKDVKMCTHCYALHILRYFPTSHIASYIRNNPTEYHLTPEER